MPSERSYMYKIRTIEEQLEIVNFHESNKNFKETREQFGIHRTTLISLLKRKDTIKSFSESFPTSLKKRKTVRKSLYPEIEKAVYLWFLQLREKRKIVNNFAIQLKAKQFAEKMGEIDFKASDGWCNNFKRRYGIKYLVKNYNEAVEPFI